MSADKQTRSKKTRKSPSDLQRLSSRFMSGLLRSLFFIHKPARFKQAGFVLPTTVLLLLVLTLTVGALSFRAFSRSGNAVALRQQQVIDSAAAPAIDRAKAKLEYLFAKDSRFPGGIPSSDVIASMMLNDNTNGIPQITSNDPYTFPGETRVDINNGNADNAWVFPSDVNGNGRIEPGELVAYSILMDDEATVAGGSTVALSADVSATKANALVTRNGPMNTSETQAGCGATRAPEGGWQVINQATLQKNFQITAFVANGSDVNRTVSAIELQQVRQADRGNKWGAWFKYDLELYPGASRDFFWNGAMHTEGNLLMRDKYVARMISSHNSCLYTEPASEITLADTGTFQGQLLSAKLRENNFFDNSSDSNDPTFHVFTANGQPPTTASKIDTTKDSVTANRADLRNILLDPIELFTKDISAHRGATGWTRDTTWNNRRIFNNPSATPYLDDTYRADNRYGPKPVYDKNHAIPTGTSVGTAITSNTALTAIDPANSIYGLDGYWERRAIGQGLRIIVGQRLELGNKFGWKGVSETNADRRDPLYPPSTSTSTEARQRRSLYDNLAAVQGMVVYHRESHGGRFPRACIASTAHPGTAESIIKSRTFNTVSVGGTAFVNTDFLNGVGTNGWEFAFPYTTDTDFANAIATTQPLGRALRNLANFAGDPSGGAPSFVPVQDTRVHPLPEMAAWGDFSNLRRIFALGTAYASLSPADQSTLHSAACTLGMLGYNLKTTLNNYGSVLTSSSLQDVGVKLSQLIDGVSSGGNPEIEDLIPGAMRKTNWTDPNPNTVNPDCPTGTDAAGFQAACDTSEYYRQFTVENWLSAYQQSASPTPTATELNDIRNAINAVQFGNQIVRDRALGFRPGNPLALSELTGGETVVWDPITGLTDRRQIGGADVIVQTACDPDIFNALTSSGGGGGSNTRSRIGLALMLCNAETATPVKYPSLYYLFPMVRHDHDGAPETGETGISPVFAVNHSQPAEEYITEITAYGANSASRYVVLTDGNNNNIEDGSEKGYADIAFVPRATDFSDWKLPTSANASVLSTPNTQPFTITFGTVGRDITLLDKGMYDGREMMSTRMLDLDIGKLANNNNVSDRWISNTDGIVYAFREDAAREDAIVRPKASGTSWADCDTWAEVYTNSSGSGSPVTGNNRDCRLKSLASTPYLQDPPLMTGSNISTKPIDFYADPDRRPYGFRLVNGATLNRGSSVQSGMTFVTDNMVYVKGDFNLHTSTGALGASSGTACSNLLEEFTARLIQNNCGLSSIDFYTGRATNQIDDTNFAVPAADKWRPVEIVGDAVGVLSNAFVDGNIQDGFTLARNQSPNGTGVSSYQNQNRLSDNGIKTASYWRHVDSSDVTTPILINRNGGVTQNSNGSAVPDSDYVRFSDSNGAFYDKRGGDLIPASRTIVNAVFISGIVPSQAGQSYGGMHNFPRFLEHWQNVDLHISGGFFQLNFSTSATAPFDQDAWEPGTDAVVSSLSSEDGHRVRFYGAPNRIWGYDVGLQYAPAGPIARRFVTVGRPRSEFYRELPANDFYVNNLRCAKYKPSNNRVYPTESCP